MSTVRKQTVSYLKRRFREVGLEPNSRHGQNFLIDMNLLRLLVDAAEIFERDVVLEVGTGTGGMTTMLADRAAAVVTVEMDSHLFQMASEELTGYDNVTMLLQDALRNKNNIDSRVLEAVEKQLAATGEHSFKLVANLPYNIATPLISNLLCLPAAPQTMTVTIQKELADRITALPGTKAYGHLSVWVQSQCEASVVRVLPPTVFWPRPQVESAIIHLVLDQDKRDRIADLMSFHRFVRSLFFHRRKFMRSVLISAFKKQLEKSDVDEVLKVTGFGPDQRAEQLTVEEILTLSDAFRAKLS
ncbi:MAG: 16S rRNA (adenine(1518)-N(6)/adenine(1519)-N(6))-dimethyltransferase RsmA [Planctomycetota bacterium]|nr:16S rRNA (adenine(1518)-N(6)/adenine(1519)-N(6))-dimethyltransferase RsmA [Planctomycetota bacterium]